MSDLVWELRGEELWLVDPDGASQSPTTDEIYGALVEGKPFRDRVPVQIEGLRASRYPLTPVLTITGEPPGLPVYSITGTVRGVSKKLAVTDLQRGYKIMDGVWYPVDSTSGKEVLDLLHKTGTELGFAHSVKAFLAIRKVAAQGGAVEDQMVEQAVSPLAFAPAKDDVPAGVNATLYPYQLAGWRWLKFLMSENMGGVLADEMGLGKTLQIISVISDAGGGSLRPALIIAPGSLLENWRREICKFAPHLKTLKHNGPRRTGRPRDLQDYDVVITSYENAVGDNSLLNMIRWKIVVLDEAQFIKNPGAQRTKAVKRLQRDAGLAVTGTPFENRLLDIWSIVDFVLPDHLGDAQSFDAHFTNDNEGATLLEPLVSPLMLRRKVRDVARDLPPRIDIPQVIELDESEASAYDAERERIFREYGAAATLVALTSLRRFCAHPALMRGEGGIADPMSFSKFRRLDEIAQEVFSLGEKFIVFTSFTAMADMIARHIEKRFQAFVGVIDGRLAIEDRQPLIDAFSATRGNAALVLNPKAGGAGLNITAANHVIHYNPEWNPALEDQASARAYRRGQTRPVTIHRLLMADTVEEVVNDRLLRKRSLSDTAVIGVEGRDEDYGDIVAALSRSPLKRAG